MTDSIVWQNPPASLSLATNEVHVWRAALQLSSNEGQDPYAVFTRLLTDEEKQRAGQFRFERHRQPWIVAHAYLRVLLSAYLHVPTTAIVFRQNEYGKPSLASPTKTTLQFNLSHSNGYALYAFSNGHALGIDVEYMRQTIDFEGLARHSFSQYEQQALLALAPTERPVAFYRCWTRKEAYIKARGMGLSLPLHLFDVSLAEQTTTALLASREDTHEVARWSLRNLQPATDYAGAVMAEGTDWRMHCWECAPSMVLDRAKLFP
jgi:4'-phosphopantetheinyl transferase